MNDSTLLHEIKGFILERLLAGEDPERLGDATPLVTSGLIGTSTAHAAADAALFGGQVQDDTWEFEGQQPEVGNGEDDDCDSEIDEGCID